VRLPPLHPLVLECAQVVEGTSEGVRRAEVVLGQIGEVHRHAVAASREVADTRRAPAALGMGWLQK